MWNPEKSIKLSLICTKFVIIFILLGTAACPFFVWQLAEAAPWIPGWVVVYFNNIPWAIFLVAFYLTCVPVLIAFFRLHGLLSAVSAGEIFIPENVRRLRVISWSCISVSLIFLATFIAFWAVDASSPVRTHFSLMILLLGMAVIIAFIGVLIRVMKNVFETAVTLKDENDFTI